jgi:hypothetical protein
MNVMRRGWPLIGALTLFACTGASSASNVPSPVAPTGTVTIARIDIGVLGSAAATVQPGQTLQLFAVATDNTGAKIDVTNLATWSSADPEKASVALGVVTGKAVGTVKVSAAYSGATSSVDTTVAVLACASSSMSPMSRVFAARASVPCSDDDGELGERVAVTAAQPTCSWTAASDVPWLGMDCYYRLPTYNPGRAGSGSLWYLPQWNNTPSPRTGHITVTFNDGSRLVHTVSQEAPACSFQLPVTEATVSRAGGSGSFDLVVTPASCQWTIGVLPGVAPMTSVSPASGTGSQRITYQVPALNQNREYELKVEGLSGFDPFVRFTIHQKN